MRRAFTLALLLSCFASIGLTCEDPTAARIGLAENLLREFEGSPFYNLEERMAFHGIPGVSVAVIRDGEIDWAKGYGTTSLDGGRAIDAATLFQAGSISKPVAAFAALQLVDAGILTLDTDVNEVLTSWQVPESQFTQLAPVTLRHLLSHAAASAGNGPDHLGLEYASRAGGRRPLEHAVGPGEVRDRPPGIPGRDSGRLPESEPRAVDGHTLIEGVRDGPGCVPVRPS